MGHPEWFEKWPGKSPLDHDYGNNDLRERLTELFATRTRAEWVQLFIDHNIAGAPVYAAGETHTDPHFQARNLWVDPAVHGVKLVGPPVRVNGHTAVAATASPRNGENQDDVLTRVLGYDAATVAELRAAGAFGASS